MRIFVLAFSFAFLSVPLFAGVEIKGSTMSANINGESLRQVLDRVKQQTGITISLDNELASQTITANFQNLPIAAGIKKMLEGTGINYAVVSDGAGKPNAVFIGMSEKAGAGPKKLDVRPPMNTRGVATPVNSYVPPPQQPSVPPSPNPQTAPPVQNPPPQIGFGTNNVVTGGGAPTTITPMNTGVVTPGTSVGTSTSPSSVTPSSLPSSNAVKPVPPTPTKGTQGNNVPTAGGFVPNTQQPQVVPPKQPEVRPGNVVVPPDVNDEDDDDDDDDEE